MAIIVKRKNGFTLVEALVAVGILLIGTVAPILSAARGVELASFAGNRVLAVHLAREALEVVRNQRDTNLLNLGSGRVWDDYLLQCQNDGCSINAFAGHDSYLTPCAGACSPPVSYEQNGFERKFGAAGNNSMYTRLVKVEKLNPAEEIKVTVTVTWQDKNSPRSLEVSTFLYDYQ